MRKTCVQWVLYIAPALTIVCIAMIPFGKIRADTLRVSLPGALGTYSAPTRKEATFDLGVYFDSIVSVSLRLTGTFSPGLGQGDGVERPVYPRFDWPLGLEAHTDSVGNKGWRVSFVGNGTFDDTRPFSGDSPPDWRFLSGGSGIMTFYCISYYIIGGIMIVPPHIQIDRAELIVDARLKPLSIICPRDTVVPINRPTHPDSLHSYPSISGGCGRNPSVEFRDSMLVGGIRRTWIASDSCGGNDTCFQGIGLGSPTGVDDNRNLLPNGSSLFQNYPNPFNPSTVIEYTLPERAHVSLSIYNLLGEHVTRLVDETQPPGTHRAAWNGTDASGSHVASGVYFYRLEAGDFVESRKMLLLK